jgi:hypothetical protein
MHQINGTLLQQFLTTNTSMNGNRASFHNNSNSNVNSNNSNNQPNLGSNSSSFASQNLHFNNNNQHHNHHNMNNPSNSHGFGQNVHGHNSNAINNNNHNHNANHQNHHNQNHMNSNVNNTIKSNQQSSLALGAPVVSQTNRNSSNTLNNPMNSLSGGLAHQANSLLGFNASSSLNIATNTNNTMANAGGVNGHVASNSNLNNLLLVQQLLSNSLPQLQNVVNGANPVTLSTVAASNSSNSMSGEILFSFFFHLIKIIK